jgi:hypothetical protein
LWNKVAKGALLAASFLAVGLIQSARAQTTYTYTGNDFTPPSHDPCTGCESIDGSFTVQNALAPDTPFGPITPSSYDFTISPAGSYTFTSGYVPYFEVGTGPDGSIDEWLIEIETNSSSSATVVQTEFIYQQGEVDVFCLTNNNNGPCNNNTDDPGTWKTETAVTPEPASVILFASGLLGIGLVTRKKSFA